MSWKAFSCVSFRFRFILLLQQVSMLRFRVNGARNRDGNSRKMRSVSERPLESETERPCRTTATWHSTAVSSSQFSLTVQRADRLILARPYPKLIRRVIPLPAVVAVLTEVASSHPCECCRCTQSAEHPHLLFRRSWNLQNSHLKSRRKFWPSHSELI